MYCMSLGQCQGKNRNDYAKLNSCFVFTSNACFINFLTEHFIPGIFWVHWTGKSEGPRDYDTQI